MNYQRLIWLKSLSYSITYRCLSFKNDKNLSIDYLKYKFSKLSYNSPIDNQYLITKYPQISNLKKLSVLIPVSIDKQASRKGFTIRRTNFILSRNESGDVNFISKQEWNNDIENLYKNVTKQIGVETTNLTHLTTLCPVCFFVGNSLSLVTPIIAFYDKTESPKESLYKTDIIEVPTKRFLSDYKHIIKFVSNQNGDFLLHYFNDKIYGDRSIKTNGFTAFICIIVSSILHSKLPKFRLLPDVIFDEKNLNEYLESCLLKNLDKLKLDNY